MPTLGCLPHLLTNQPVNAAAAGGMPPAMRGMQVPFVARMVLLLGVLRCGMLWLVGSHVVQLLVVLLIQVLLAVHALLIQPPG